MATPYDQLYANSPFSIGYGNQGLGNLSSGPYPMAQPTTMQNPQDPTFGQPREQTVNYLTNTSGDGRPVAGAFGSFSGPVLGGTSPVFSSGGENPYQIGGGQSMGTPMPKPQGGMDQGGQIGQSLGNVSTMGQNPYLPQMFDAVTNQVTTNFNRNVMPRIQSQMAASGGYGGSRQGVVEANAMRDMNEVLANSLSGLAGNAYGQSLNYDLGLRGNDLGYANLDANIAQNNFNNQLTGANFGLGLYDRLQMGNQAGINAGTNIQNTPMNYWSQFGNQFNSIGQGYGSTTGSNSQGGNPAMGALGGWQLGSQWSNSRPQVGSWNDTTYGPAF